MRHLLLLVSFLLCACENDNTRHKMLFFSFTDLGLGAIATTEIEPGTRKVTALHLVSEPEDVAEDFSTKNVDLAMGADAEILVYKINDLHNASSCSRPFPKKKYTGYHIKASYMSLL